MANLLYQQIEMLSREKHIEPEVVVSAIEDAMVVAARKYYKTEEDLRAKFNQDTGQVDVFTVHMVVEEVTDPKREISLTEAKKKNPAAEVGTEILTAKPTDVLGRIAAQTAKQVILQKVREAERDTIFNEYHTRVGELVTVIVKRSASRTFCRITCLAVCAAMRPSTSVGFGPKISVPTSAAGFFFFASVRLISFFGSVTSSTTICTVNTSTCPVS